MVAVPWRVAAASSRSFVAGLKLACGILPFWQRHGAWRGCSGRRPRRPRHRSPRSAAGGAGAAFRGRPCSAPAPARRAMRAALGGGAPVQPRRPTRNDPLQRGGQSSDVAPGAGRDQPARPPKSGSPLDPGSKATQCRRAWRLASAPVPLTKRVMVRQVTAALLSPPSIARPRGGEHCPDGCMGCAIPG